MAIGAKVALMISEVRRWLRPGAAAVVLAATGCGDRGPNGGGSADVCVDGAGCDDADPCTTDTCVGGSCTHDAIDGCLSCASSADCDDENRCTHDICTAGLCGHDEVEGCTRCVESAECDDGDECTTDVCREGACESDLVVDCGECSLDRECDDDDACTADRCVEGVCSNSSIPGCCGNGICDGEETALDCPGDCFCGNVTCEPSEDCASCPEDCLATCGDAVCDSECEDSTSCPADCMCGDFICDAAEDCGSCPGDCSEVCGNGFCAAACEDPTSCPADCTDATCGDDICEAEVGEDCLTCAPDCGGCVSIFGTDAFGYVGSAQVVVTPPCPDLSATGTSLALGDDDKMDVPIGFSFDFYGTATSTVAVGSNGKLFTNSETPLNNCLPGFFENAAVFVWWDDLNPSADGTVRHQTSGPPGSRTFAVQWTVPHFDEGSGTIDARAVLYEGSNDIDVCYVDTVLDLAEHDHGATATTGIQGPEGEVLEYSCNARALVPGLVLHYAHP